MIKEDAGKDTKTPYDDVLLIAWKRTLDIGSVSTKYKQQYTALRRVAIVLSLLTTFFAVLIGLNTPTFLGEEWMVWLVALLVFIPSVAYAIGYAGLYQFSERRSKPDLDTWIASNPVTFIFFIVLVAVSTWLVSLIQFGTFEITLPFFFRFVVLALPIFGSAVVLYGRNFASSIWIDYRVQAEIIRSEIYKYRIIKCLDINESSIQTARTDLLNIIANSSEQLASLPNPIPYLQRQESTATLVERINNESYDRNPLDPLSIGDYIQVRVKEQKNWYASRVERDHKNLQNYFIIGQCVAVFGAMLSGFDLVHLVAITASITTALTLTADVNMYGATYGLFHLTAVRLENALSNWYADENSAEDPTRVLDFVALIESILANEREVWEKQAKQLQAQAQQGIDGSNLDTSDTDMEMVAMAMAKSPSGIRATSETAILNPSVESNGKPATDLKMIDTEQTESVAS